MAIPRAVPFVVCGLALAVVLLATSRPAASDGAATPTHAFFAELATGQTEAACAGLAPSARRQLAPSGGCVHVLGALRRALMGPPGKPGSLTPQALLARMDAASTVEPGPTAASAVRVEVAPCLGVFAVARRTTRGPWAITSVPFR